MNAEPQAATTRTRTPILRLVGVERHYSDAAGKLTVLDKADLAVYPGELVALVAPSGAGKSTLLHIAGLLERPDGGDVMIGGRSAGEPLRRRAHGDPPHPDRLRLPVPPPAAASSPRSRTSSSRS